MSRPSESTDQVVRTNERLRRMGTAIDSNALSDSTIQTNEGKALLEHMLTSVVADDFDPAQSRKLITDRLAVMGK